MRANLLAAVVASLILLSAAHTGATGSHGGHHGSGENNVDKTTISNKNHDNNSNNNVNNLSNNNNNASANTSRSNSKASARASADANAASGSGDGGSSEVSVDGDDESPASSAAAVYITTSDDTCMGSSSGGGQAESFGFSVGAAWTDSNCIMLKNARELKAQGHHKAAKARLCMDEDNAMAFELAGEPCPRALPSTQAAIAKLRAADPSYVAAGEPAAQLAMLGDGHGVAGAVADAVSGGGGDDAPQLGDLLAMVQSAVQHAAAALSAAAADDAPDLYEDLYGIE